MRPQRARQRERGGQGEREEPGEIGPQKTLPSRVSPPTNTTFLFSALPSSLWHLPPLPLVSPSVCLVDVRRESELPKIKEDMRPSERGTMEGRKRVVSLSFLVYPPSHSRPGDDAQ